MNEQSPPNISVTQPVELAIERVKQILFRPFDFAKWISIGFCAWLATIGQGGSNFNFNKQSLPGKNNFNHALAQARDYTMDNLVWIIPLTAVLILILAVVWIALVWLSSRGKFMFLHCVAMNRGEVAVPWRKYAPEAKSLFLFRLALGVTGIFISILMLAIIADPLLKAFQHNWDFSTGSWLLIIPTILLYLFACILLGIINSLTTNFVVPLMYLRGGSCQKNWEVIYNLIKANFGNWIIYFLFQILLGIGIFILIMLVVLITCCVAGCLIALPFIGSVLLLPITVFQRSYALYYIAQYGPEYDVFFSNSQPDQI